MNFFKKYIKRLNTPVSIAPLVVFRIIFGFLMGLSIVRFAWHGWIDSLYIQPVYYFSYYGFEWILRPDELGIYFLFGVMFLSSIGVMLGFWYRLSSLLFFLSFTYVELIDKTNYLNHYYFVSIVSCLMIFLPAHHYFSIDSQRNPLILKKLIPAWMVWAVKLQLGIVYFYAGIAKLNFDWLFRAMPLKIWLKAHTGLPILGELFKYDITAYLFSWSGAIYDLFIPFILINKRLRPYGYLAVIAFHLLTRWLFPIGMFPYIMIFSTLIFFDVSFHEKILKKAHLIFNVRSYQKSARKKLPLLPTKIIGILFTVHFLVQIVFPFRYILYPDYLFWTEEGFRFSWRVMLIEKAGYAIFEVTDADTGRKFEISNRAYLTPQQEKMMATQPDMILEFAHFLGKEMRQKGIKNPEIRVKSYVTLNGSGSRPFIDETVDLLKEKDSFKHKTWILPFQTTH